MQISKSPFKLIRASISPSSIPGFSTPALILFFLFCLFTISSYGQKKKPKNLEKHDHHLLNFGFSLGVNTTDFILDPDNNLHYNDTLYVVEPSRGSGFNLGIVSELRLGEYFNLRFIPDLSFTERYLNYSFEINGKKTASKKKVESTFIEFPVNIKYKSERVNNYRFYVLAGIKYSIDLASQRNVEELSPDPYKSVLKIQNKDFGYEIGVGMDCYLHYFRFSPEFKMYHGLNNLIVHDGRVFSQSVSSLKSKIFLISFIFE